MADAPRWAVQKADYGDWAKGCQDLSVMQRRSDKSWKKVGEIRTNFEPDGGKIWRISVLKG
jgi:hypothetical protein